MSLNVAALRSSFDLVVERSPNLTSRFYDILFERHPEVRPLFGRNARANQEKMLTGALVAVIDHVEDATWLTETLGGMGAKHVSYGVTAEMYPWVADALLATLAEVASEAWTAEVALAWEQALGAIASLMLAGAATVESAAAAKPSHPAAAAPVVAPAS